MNDLKPRRRRASPTQAAAREYRILGWLQAVLSPQEIAGLAGVSRTRVRDIVAVGLEARQEDLTLDPKRLAELRLALALRLAAKTMTGCELPGVDRLVNVIDRVIQLRSERVRRHDENARAKLLAKINLNMGRSRQLKTRLNHSQAFENAKSGTLAISAYFRLFPLISGIR